MGVTHVHALELVPDPLELLEVDVGPDLEELQEPLSERLMDDRGDVVLEETLTNQAIYLGEMYWRGQWAVYPSSVSWRRPTPLGLGESSPSSSRRAARSSSFVPVPCPFRCSCPS